MRSFKRNIYRLSTADAFICTPLAGTAEVTQIPGSLVVNNYSNSGTISQVLVNGISVYGLSIFAGNSVNIPYNVGNTPLPHTVEIGYYTTIDTAVTLYGGDAQCQYGPGGAIFSTDLTGNPNIGLTLGTEGAPCMN
jgi:hypothetical protein